MRGDEERRGPPGDLERGTTSGVTRVRSYPGEVRSGGYRPRDKSRGRLRGILFLLVTALVVLVLAVTVGVPALGRFARGVAQSNPEALRLPFMADLVKGQLGDGLTRPAGTDSAPISFQVAPGASAQEVADGLVAQRLISDPLVFQYLVVTRNLAGKLKAGTYTLNQTMTPDEIVQRLQAPPDPAPRRVAIELREGLRIEQITAYLETLDLNTDIAAFYDLAIHPPASLRADYPFLAQLPEGRSLEGFLAGGVFTVSPDVSPEDLLRALLDRWSESVGIDVIQQAETQHQNFYEVLTLASIVEKEAALDEERALIAGVYVNRLKQNIALSADPTVFYGNDTLELRKLDLGEWPNYAFNHRPEGKTLIEITLPGDLAGYQTYLSRGLPPGPICSPTLQSIQAALAPDTQAGYLFFVAKNDGSRSHAFAKTQAEHNRNVKKYLSSAPSDSPEPSGNPSATP